MKRSEWADEWYQRGKRELNAATLLRQGGFWDACALMCQQAAEKVVKALWIDLKGSDAPRVHWVDRLAEQLGAPENVIDDAAILSADYSASRYPAGGTFGPSGAFTEEDADDRIGRAQSVITWAENHWEANDGD